MRGDRLRRQRSEKHAAPTVEKKGAVIELKSKQILGWETRWLKVSFAACPTVHVMKGRPQVSFEHTGRPLGYPICAEVYVTRLLDREEFRAHCDRYQTRSEILSHLL